MRPFDIQRAITIVGSQLPYHIHPIRRGADKVEGDHSSDIGADVPSSLVNNLPGISQSPKNAAKLSAINTTPAVPLMNEKLD